MKIKEKWKILLNAVFKRFNLIFHSFTCREFSRIVTRSGFEPETPSLKVKCSTY